MTYSKVTEIKALRKVDYSDFCIYAKLETQNIAIFCIYQNYLVKIECSFLQNTCSESNFNLIYDYNYGTQELNQI